MPPSEAQEDGRADAARTYRIRPATMGDSPAIRRIRNAAVRESLAIWTSIEQDHAEDVEAAADWGRKALAASSKADELRGAGDAAGADKFDTLAKVAIGKQIAAEKEAKDAEPTIARSAQTPRRRRGLRHTLGSSYRSVSHRSRIHRPAPSSPLDARRRTLCRRCRRRHGPAGRRWTDP